MQTRIRNGFFPAVPVPMAYSGVVDDTAELSYIKWMTSHDITGVAVWAHTGRGLWLDDIQREKTARRWREHLGDKILICGVGSRDGSTEAEIVDEAVSMAKAAKECGADAVLAFPPSKLQGQQRQKAIVRYHEALVEVGLPVIAFYLYEQAGGLLYDDETLTAILSLDGVVGLKSATLDSVMRFQEIAQLMESFPTKALLTGEDRMFGYSLMRGATGALVGLGAVETELQLKMFRAWQRQDFSSFVRFSQIVDTLAEVTFIQPMEGYVARLLHVLGLRGIIPEQSTFDPWGPGITEMEKNRIAEVLALIDACRREE